MSRGRGMLGICRCDGMTHRPGMWAGLGSWYDWNVGGVYANEVGGRGLHKEGL